MGAGAATFPFAVLWEIWFAGSDERRRACGDPRFIEGLCGADVTRHVAFGVSEVVIYSDAVPVAAEGATP